MYCLHVLLYVCVYSIIPKKSGLRYCNYALVEMTPIESLNMSDIKKDNTSERERGTEGQNVRQYIKHKRSVTS